MVASRHVLVASLSVCGAASALTTADLAPLLSRRQSSSAREAVETMIASLTPRAPPRLSAGQLNGRWKLLWSSQTADVNPLATPDSVLGGESIQEVTLSRERCGRLDNIVQWAPRWQLVGGATLSPAAGGPSGGARSILSVDSVVVELGGMRFDFSLSWLAKLIDGAKRQESEDEGTGAEEQGDLGRGWLECIYLDEPLRISRDNTGLLYVHSRLLP